MKTVWIVTHGEKNRGPDPIMTLEGLRQVNELRSLLPSKVEFVVCGTGYRHQEMLEALGLENAPTIRWTPAVGGPESLEGDTVVLPNNQGVSRELYYVADERAAGILAVLQAVPDGAVICAGRPAIIALGEGDRRAKSAAVYKITWPEAVVSFETAPALASLRIEQVQALGQTETGAV